ncbi:MAG: pentapeptide repeat-containing protein [Treponemataceae bacterium]
MLLLNPCQHKNCEKRSLSHFDSHGQIINDPWFCLEHCPDPDKAMMDIHNYISVHEKIISLSADYIVFDGNDFTNKKFYGCTFCHCAFRNIQAENCRLRMAFFDFSMFSDCNFRHSNMQYVSFACSTFSHVLWTNSDLVHNNFNGMTSYQSSFDDSDLYNSRFIRSTLIATSFQNCNIKSTCFYNAKKDNVSFRASNTREADFTQKEKKFENLYAFIN